MPDEARPEPDGDSRAPKTDNPAEKSSPSIEHSQLPDDLERLALMQLWLTDGVGPTRVQSLIDGLGSAAKVVEAPLSLLQTVHGIGPKLANLIRQDGAKERAEAELARQQKLGIRWESWHEYAERLRAIVDPPIGITLLGEITSADTPAIAIVGSRRCSFYGRRLAGKLAQDLAYRGITVVSGLARGIDGIAHAAALDAGGRTIAVLASGLANVYPPEHTKLAERIINEKRGAIISEASCDGVPEGGLFPRRNRIISGLSEAIIVIEASMKSGALSTARHALDQNRDVFAVPGRVGDPTSEGTNWLIKQGASPITCIEDLLDALPELTNAVRARQAKLPPTLFDGVPNSAQAQSSGNAPSATDTSPSGKILAAIGNDELTLEEILDQTGMRASEVSASLLMLELGKKIERRPGNRFSRKL